MTMQTTPLSPSCATTYPVPVSTLIVARSEMAAGAALRASAISASRGIRYSLSGGYFVPSARTVAPARTAGNKTSASVDFLMSISFSVLDEPPTGTTAPGRYGIRRPGGARSGRVVDDDGGSRL